MTDYSAMIDAAIAAAELAARRAVIASCYGVPPGYVPHCGVCGKPLPCQCGTTPARDAPETVVPVMEPPPIGPGGLAWCERCGFAMLYCKGHPA